MEKLYKLKEDLIAELEEYTDKRNKTEQDYMVIKCLASGADHICNILEKADKKSEGQYGMYPRYWGDDGQYMDGNKMYGRNQARASNGRYMDGQSGGTYQGYGHDENPMEALRRMIDNARDPNERRVLEDAMNRLNR